jgi:hypothetical protein
MPLLRVEVYDVDPSSLEQSPQDQNPVYLRDPPWRLLAYDFFLLLRKSHNFFNILNPLPAIGVDITFSGLMGQVLLVLITSMVMMFCVFATIFPIFWPLIPLTIWTVVKTSNWLQGPYRKLDSKPTLDGKTRRKYEHETWML